MVPTPGSSGAAGSARAPTYRDRTVKAHDKYWPEVDTIAPFLKELEDKWNALAQSHLTRRALFRSHQDTVVAWRSNVSIFGKYATKYSN